MFTAHLSETIILCNQDKWKIGPNNHWLLLQADDGKSSQTGNVANVVTKIINVFVDALPHVPEHRRLPILGQLVRTVGPERFLWVLLLLLFKQHVTKTASTATNGDKVGWNKDLSLSELKRALHSGLLLIHFQEPGRK